MLFAVNHPKIAWNLLSHWSVGKLTTPEWRVGKYDKFDSSGYDIGNKPYIGFKWSMKW